MAADGADFAQPRWWRRGRDLALREAQAAHQEASATMARLEALEADLTELSGIHTDAAALASGADRIGFTTPLSNEWDTLSVQTGIPALEFYEMNAGYDPGIDHEEADARRLAAGFTSISARLQALFPEIEAFRHRHDAALNDAAALRDGVPDKIEEATTLLDGVARLVAAARQAGLSDPAALAAHDTATIRLRSARDAHGERRWVAADADATTAIEQSRVARQRAQDLEGAADRLRKDHLSVRTRRDALRTRHDQLPDVMSQLRRRYTHRTWQHVEDVPKKVTAAVGAVDRGLAELDRVLAQRPMDVPKATAVLANIRDELGSADRMLRTTVELLRRLDHVADDPGRLISDVRRRLVDARRFISGRGEAASARFGPTLDGIAGRAERLADATGATRPDWGALIIEADSIEAAIDSMIRSARG